MPENTQVVNPFAGGAVAARPIEATGLMAVEAQRVMMEVQGRMMVARKFPRDPVQAMQNILTDCQRPSLAEAAIFQYARGGTDIEGPSIKLMEAIAARWGNVACGFKEISRANGASEVLIEAWDLESLFYDYRQIQVKHWRDTQKGGYALKDERDIYESIANQAQRRKREVLRAVIPRDVVEAAVRQCEETMKAQADTTPEAMQKMVAAFAPWKITREHIEKRIQRRLDAITPAQVVGLKKVYTSLRDGMSEPGDWFDMSLTGATETAQEAPEAPQRPAGNAGLRAALKARQQRQAKDERTPQVPDQEMPTVERALSLVEEGDIDAAYDLAQALGNGAVKQVDAAVKARKDAADDIPQ